MKNYNILRLFVIAVMLHFLPLQAQKVWTFDECVQYAIDHNVSIQQKAFDIKIQENQLNTTKYDWLPSINAFAAQRFSFGNAYASTGTMASSSVTYNANLSYTNAAVELQMPIFDGLRHKNQKQADLWAVQQATASHASAIKSLSIQIASYYLQALYERGMMEVALAQVETSQQICEKTKALVNDRRSPVSDLADAQAQLAVDEYELTEARGRYRIALLTLSQLLNLETNEGFEIADINDLSLDGSPTDTPSLFSIDDIIELHPSIQAGKAQVEKSRYDIATVRANYYPKLDFSASINTYYLYLFNQSNPNGFGSQIWNNKSELLGLYLTIPIFNRFASRNSIRRAKLSLSQSQLVLDDSRQQLRKEIEQAYYNAVNAQSRYHAAQKAEESSRIAASYENDKYEAGRSTIYDLSQAQQRLRKSRENLVQAKYEYIIRQKILDIYTK